MVAGTEFLFVTPFEIRNPWTGQYIEPGGEVRYSLRLAHIASEIPGLYDSPRPTHTLESMFGRRLCDLALIVVYIGTHSSLIIEDLERHAGRRKVVCVAAVDIPPEDFWRVIFKQTLETGDVPKLPGVSGCALAS